MQIGNQRIIKTQSSFNIPVTVFGHGVQHISKGQRSGHESIFVADSKKLADVQNNCGSTWNHRSSHWERFGYPGTFDGQPDIKQGHSRDDLGLK